MRLAESDHSDGWSQIRYDVLDIAVGSRVEVTEVRADKFRSCTVYEVTAEGLKPLS